MPEVNLSASTDTFKSLAKLIFSYRLNAGSATLSTEIGELFHIVEKLKQDPDATLSDDERRFIPAMEIKTKEETFKSLLILKEPDELVKMLSEDGIEDINTRKQELYKALNLATLGRVDVPVRNKNGQKTVREILERGTEVIDAMITILNVGMEPDFLTDAMGKDPCDEFQHEQLESLRTVRQMWGHLLKNMPPQTLEVVRDS